MAGSRPARIMGLFWMYTGLRVLVFLVLFGALWLVGVRGLLGALIALVLGIPLSIYVLAGPRARLAEALQEHVDARSNHQAQLRRRLNGDALDGDAPRADALDGSHEALDGDRDAIDLRKRRSDDAPERIAREAAAERDPRANRPDGHR